MRFFSVLIILFVLSISCNLITTHQEKSELDSIDYKIFSILLDKYVIPEIDSSIMLDEKTGNLISVKNPRRNLLIIDSTRLFSVDKNVSDLKSDSILFAAFKMQNKFRCKIDTDFYSAVIFYGISDSLFKGPFKNISIRHYDDLYSNYKDVAGIIEFSNIGYNPNKTKALVEICLYRSPLNSFGFFVWLDLKNGTWRISKYQIDWIT